MEHAVFAQLTPDQRRLLDRIRFLAELLDSRFTLPGTQFRFGIDPLLGLLPGIGDTVSTLLSLVILHHARELGAPLPLMARMAGNVFFDWLSGSIPLFGDVFDAYFKANRKNLALLVAHLERRAGATSA